MTDAEWIKLRLPSGVAFTKNGVTLSLESAVSSALSDYSTSVAAAQKYFAIADLLEILLSDCEADEERQGDYFAGKKRSALLDDIERYRSTGTDIQNGDDEPGTSGFVNVPLDRTLGDTTDTYLDEYADDAT